MSKSPPVAVVMGAKVRSVEMNQILETRSIVEVGRINLLPLSNRVGILSHSVRSIRSPTTSATTSSSLSA